MKNKLIFFTILSFCLQTAVFSQNRREEFNSEYKKLLKIAEDTNWKYYNYIQFTETVKNSDIDITLKGKKWIRVTMFHNLKCKAEYGLKSPDKILGLDRDKIQKSQGYTYQTLSFISNYSQKMNFWVKVDASCKDYGGTGRIAIHYKDVK